MNSDVLEPVVSMKEEVETMWQECSTQQLRRTVACKSVPGFCIFADNVGFQVNPRHNTGFSNKGMYVTLSQAIIVKNRVASAHLKLA